MTIETLYTIQEIAKMLKVGKATVTRYINNKKIKAIKLPNSQWRIKESDYNAFISK